MQKFFLSLIFFMPVMCFAIDIPSSQIIENFEATNNETKSGAVLLFKDVFHEVQNDGKDKGYVHIAIAVLDKKAVNDYGQIEIGYDAYYTAIEFEYAKIINKDGSIKTVSADAYQVQKSSKDQFYDNSKVIKFSLPGLKPGSIIEYRYSFKALKPNIKNEWMKNYRFHYIQKIPNLDWARIDPIRHSRLKLVLPSTMALLSHAHNNKNDKVYTKMGSSHSYVWDKKNLSGIKIENNMPGINKTLPYLELSTLENWRKIDQWVISLIKPSVKITPEISQIAQSIKKNNSSIDGKVKAVFDYVQDNIRYVYAHVDSNGYTPHKASVVLANKYGDCKDQSILIITLLKALGITAYPSLINSSVSKINKDSLPTLNFNHMIVNVPDHSKYHWLDTSGETGAFPGISPQLDEQHAFILDGKGGKLQQLNHKGTNKVLYLVNFKNKNDSQVEADISLIFTGIFDTYFRSWYKNSQDKKNDLHRIMGDLFQTAEVSSVSVLNDKTRDKPFTLKGKLLIQKTGEKDKFAFSSTAVTLLNTFTNIKSLPLPSDRVHPFVNGSTYQLSSKISFETTDKTYQPLIVQSGVNYDNEFFTLKHDFIKTKDDIAITLDFNSKKQTLKKTEYKKFYNFINNAIKASQSIVVYEKRKSTPALSKTSTINKDKTGINILLSEARISLDKADYENAKKLAEEALKLSVNSAEAYYILGLATGFLDDYESSEKFLKKAEDLGYQP